MVIGVRILHHDRTGTEQMKRQNKLNVALPRHNMGQDSFIDDGETEDANTTIKSKTGCKERVIGFIGLEVARGLRRVRNVTCCTGLSRSAAVEQQL